MSDPEPLGLDAARDALERHVRRSVFLRRGLAATLDVTAHRTPGAHHVVFESFTEARHTDAAHRPYRGGPVDGPEGGPVPEAWDVGAAPRAEFATETARYVVPHTERVATCHGCGGDGSVHCGSCGGSGSVTCSRCGGSGSITHSRTVTTVGSDGQSTTATETYSESCATTQTCSGCGGSGRVTCGVCHGAGRLVHYTQLTVAWVNHATDQVLEHTALPDDLIRHAGGVTALREVDYRIEATAGGGAGAFRGGLQRVDAAVDAAANALIAGHAFPGDVKLLRQRLTVRAVPVFEASYTWGKRGRLFWVYGTDKRVHAPGYPLSHARLGILAAVVTALIGLGVLAAATRGRPPPDSWTRDSDARAVLDAGARADVATTPDAVSTAETAPAAVDAAVAPRVTVPDRPDATPDVPPRVVRHPPRRPR